MILVWVWVCGLGRSWMPQRLIVILLTISWSTTHFWLNFDPSPFCAKRITHINDLYHVVVLKSSKLPSAHQSKIFRQEKIGPNGKSTEDPIGNNVVFMLRPQITKLVGGWPTLLKNMSSSVGIMILNIWKNKHVPNHQITKSRSWKSKMDLGNGSIVPFSRWSWTKPMGLWS